jgi:hypothetical protein
MFASVLPNEGEFAKPTFLDTKCEGQVPVERLTCPKERLKEL